MSKPFKTYEEQIELLQNRGLIIDNENEAYSMLEMEGYFNIINGYKDIFLQQRNPEEKFINGTKFSFIADLFYFDRNLKNTVLNYILKLENSLKSIIAYEFAKAHGENGYLDIANYSNSPRLSQKITNFIVNCVNQLNDLEKDGTQKSDCVRHYKKNHGGLPIWVYTNYMTFGCTSYFYTLLQPSTKTNIVNHINNTYKCNLISQDVATYLRYLVNIRNICAHNQRLYNYTTRIRLCSNNATINSLGLLNTSPTCSNLNILVLIFYDLLDRQDFLSFTKVLSGGIIRLKFENVSISDKFKKNLSIDFNILLKLLKNTIK